MATQKTKPRKKKGFLWKFSGLILALILFFVLLFTFTPSVVEAFFNGFKDLKPKSKTVLPVDIQKAITTEAVKELNQGYDYKYTDVTAEVDPQDIQVAESRILADNPLYIFKKAGRKIQELLTFDSLSKTQLILKHNSWETIETISLLQKNLEQNNPLIKGFVVNLAANEISQVEDRFNQILSISDSVGKTDKDKAKAINAVAFNYTEKYFRQELILQGLEEKFDDSSLIKIEKARTKGLGAFAKILINYHPDPQILARELANSLATVAGSNYKELKTAELLQELEDVVTSDSQKNSLRLTQYILIERFEKKLLSMSTTKRQVLLNTLVSELPGNPMREFKTFSRVRKVFKSPELIVYAELYKARILEHFEARVLGLSTTDLQSQFVTNWVSDPADLRILEALELRTSGEKNKDLKLAELVKNLKKLGHDQITKLYGSTPDKLKDTLFYESATLYPDVLDIKVAVDFGNKDLEKQVVDKFVSNLPASLSDVVIAASPETTNLLAEIRSDISVASLNEITAAITAEITLDSLQVPENSNAIENASAINNLVNELEQSQDIAIVTQALQIPIEEIITQADTQVSGPTTVEVLQRTEELTEEIFSAPAGEVSPIEQELTPTVQQEIQQVQQTTNSVPQVDQNLVQTVVNTVEQTTPTAAPEVTVPTTPAQTNVTTTTTNPVITPEAPPPATTTVPAL